MLRETDNEGPAREGLERKKDFIENWARGHSFAIIAFQNLASFFLCPKNLSKAEFKSNGRIYLAGGILTQDHNVAVAWLTRSTLRKIYSEGAEKDMQI